MCGDKHFATTRLVTYIFFVILCNTHRTNGFKTPL